MNMNLERSEDEIKKVLQDYFQNDYDTAEFCYVNEITETDLQLWIEKYPQQRAAFIDLVAKQELKSQSLPKKNQRIELKLFARVTDEGIEIYKETSASFLKSLRP